ncbi:hypothetical protein VNO78_10333 [Psophocarpus tetragonolobus]|uniref:Uncharacterized protein n=1 Tax=Psophocarpus tetragonolobus TaxID=3891 RepID=A0AAN9XMV8_PSOTE
MGIKHKMRNHKACSEAFCKGCYEVVQMLGPRMSFEDAIVRLIENSRQSLDVAVVSANSKEWEHVLCRIILATLH